MKIAYFDCIAGASGDMILGALVDVGLPLATLQARLNALNLPDFELRARRVAKNAFIATKVDVIVADTVPERHLADILAIVEQSDLSPTIKAQAIAIFRKIGAAEAAIHGTSLDEVHLHELGGVDTIVDVVGALVGLDALGIERIIVSPVPLGRGAIRGAHGHIPLPAPATIALLKGVPIVGSPLEVETVTPTGAALLASLGDDFGPIPPMTLEEVGYGAGNRDMAIPNVLRLLIGESTDPQRSKSRITTLEPHDHPHGHTHDHGHDHPHDHPHDHDHTHLASDIRHPVSCLDHTSLKVLETNIDDLNPETYEYVMDRLFATGALDVFLIPIHMKKNRPATLLRVLCAPDDVEALTAILFTETTTLGVREQTVARHALPRRILQVETPYGPVHVKIADLPDGAHKAAPEYEDCRRLAAAHNAPLRDVYLAAQLAVSSHVEREAGPPSASP